MIIGPLSTIAFKCSACGKIRYDNINIFEKNKAVICDCKEDSLQINYKNKEYIINIKCFACNKYHIYTIKAKDFWDEKVIKFSCPDTKIQVGYIGKDDLIRDALDNYELRLDSILDEYDNFEKYFKNDVVMLNVVNIIHDMAEAGNVKCTCGENRIELDIENDRVILQCAKCDNFEYVFASTNMHLKYIERKKEIILSNKNVSIL
jgi:hypothetical protein